MTEEQILKKYQQFTPMLVKFSRKFSNIYGIEFEEMLAESNLIFMETIRNCEIEAAFSSYLFTALENKLKHYGKQLNYSTNISEHILENIQYKDNYQSVIELNESLQKLTPLAKKIVKICFNPNKLTIYMSKIRKKIVTKNSIEKYFSPNYTIRSIRNAFYEIKNAIN